MIIKKGQIMTNNLLISTRILTQSGESTCWTYLWNGKIGYPAIESGNCFFLIMHPKQINEFLVL